MLDSLRICGIDLVGEENSAVGRICGTDKTGAWNERIKQGSYRSGKTGKGQGI